MVDHLQNDGLSGPRRIALEDRAFLSLEGPDARTLLQGLITNDVEQVSAERAIYAALLTPQGKFLFDFILMQSDPERADALLLDTPADRAPTLLKRLTMYKLRADVRLANVTQAWSVCAILDPEDGTASNEVPGTVAPAGAGFSVRDPRHGGLGRRLLLPAGEAVPDPWAAIETGTPADYERRRLGLGIPLSGTDILPEASFLLESNVEEMNGVDFRKGCYVGQELTARTKHRGTVRKRILTLDLDAPVPEAGTPVQAGTREIGTILSGGMAASGASRVLALIRIDRWRDEGDAPITVGGIAAQLSVPDWVELPESAANT